MNEKMQYTKFKHLIVMVLTLFVTFGIVVGTKTIDVNAAEDIEEVTLHFEARPVIGNTYKTDDFKEVCSIVKKEDTDPDTCYLSSSSEIPEVRWYNGRSTYDADKITNGDKFVANKEYTAHVVLLTESGYSWKKSGGKVTTKISAYGGEVYNVANPYGNTLFVDVCFKAAEGLRRVNITITEPEVGKTPAQTFECTTVPANAFKEGCNPFQTTLDAINKDSGESFWEVSETGGNNFSEWKAMSNTDTFKAGYYYRINRNFVIGPPMGITLSFESFVDDKYSGLCEDFDFYYNGVSYLSTDEYSVLKWGKLLGYISKVECKVKIPVDGNKPDYSPSFTGDDSVKLQYGEYKSGSETIFNKIGWYKKDSSNNWILMKSDETFEAGKEYQAALYVEPKKDCYYNSGVKYYINGNEVELNTILTYVFTAVPKVKELYFTIPEPVEGESIGNVMIEADVKNAILPSTIDALNKTGSKGYQVSENGTDYTDMKPTDKFEAGKYYRNNIVGAWFVAGLIVEIAGKCMYDQNYAGGSILTAKYYINGKELTAASSSSLTNFGKLEPKPTPTPTPTPTPGPETPAVSPDGIAAEGTELAALEEVVVATENDKDLVGSSYNKLQAKASKVAKKTITLKWNEVEGAEGYIIYGNKCAKGNKYEKITELPAETLKFTHKKLKKGTYYKYLVVAYKTVDGKKVVITTSKTIHAATTGGKVGNAKSIKVTKPSNKKKTLKVGKKFTLKAKQVPKNETLKIKNHRKLSYESSDPAIATVSSKGKIKAVSAGTCYIYVYAQNGVSTKVKIKVKE
ncbi:MAG: Ig-like domain-containing protein [Lachnospiraceae bacterium]|nr:Ig-like domain-containing protein [Lachnospiraceae bacterium]